MQSIRVLTGRHAGSQMKLRREHHRIGSQADCDIQIGDWTGDALSILSLDGRPACLVHAMPDDASNPDTLAQLIDFKPVRVGGIVLCAGPQSGEWPSDTALLAKVAAAPSPPRQHTAWWRVAVALSVLLAPLALIVKAHQNDVPHTASAPPASPSPSQQVQTALRRAGLDSLRVRDADALVMVEGILPDASSVARTRSVLQRFGAGVAHRYASAVAIGQSISEALGEPALTITHEGQGVFKATGNVVDSNRVALAVRRIEHDLSPLVTRIELDLGEAPAPSRLQVGAMLSSRDLSYVQTSDGVKHLTLPHIADTVPPQTTAGTGKETRP